MLDEAIDPRPVAQTFARMIGDPALVDALQRDPDSLARNWNDRQSVWANLRDFRHWIERARS
jgi:hypothetical protein